MIIKRTIKSLAGLIVVLILAFLTVKQSARPSIADPPAEVQGQSFSIADVDPLSSTGVHPADILGIGGAPLISCEHLGLVCTDPSTGDQDDVVGLSFGWDFSPNGLPPMQFSTDDGSRGLTGTALRVEADCTPSQPQADVFETALDGSNFQDLDGDGTACGSNTGYGLGLTEGSTSDNVDAAGRDPCQFVDLDCDGNPEEPIFFTLASGSPSLVLFGAAPADILSTVEGFAVTVWADGVADLGLAPGDAIDAICIRENGNGVYDSGDKLLISLASGSPTLTSLSASPADLLRPSPPRVLYHASSLGSETTDDIDALTCSFELTIYDLYLPIVMDSP